MRLQGLRGNCDFQGKQEMCPSLAEPDASGFPKNSSCIISYKPFPLHKTFLHPLKAPCNLIGFVV